MSDKPNTAETSALATVIATACDKWADEPNDGGDELRGLAAIIDAAGLAALTAERDEALTALTHSNQTLLARKREIVELKAAVDRLPKFKDGKTANRGDRAWFDSGYGDRPVCGIVTVDAGWGAQHEPLANCYSTEALARAASEAKA